MTPEADVEGRLLRKIAILKSTGGVQGKAFVTDNKFRSQGDGRNILQCSKKKQNNVILPICYKVLYAVRIIDLDMSCHEGHGVPCTDSLCVEGYMQM